MDADMLKHVKRNITRDMQKNYKMWEQMGYEPICQISMDRIAESAATGMYEKLKEKKIGKIDSFLENYGAACQCYYLHRSLHERTDRDTKTAVLLGDYFFGEFSRYMIPVNSPEIIRNFSEKLRKDTIQYIGSRAKKWELDDYIAFVGRIPDELAEETV